MAKLKTAPEDVAAEPKPKEEKPRSLSDNFLRVWAPTLVTALFIITFNVQAFEIPSPSMENTLLVGDHVLVDRVRFAPASNYLHGIEPYRPLQHGDIVVFMSVIQPGLHLVKRVMGVPGDHLKLVHKIVYRNGVALNEPYVYHTDNYNPARDDWPNSGPLASERTPEWVQDPSKYMQNGEVVVPPGHYFMMGDNRDVSYDSRYWGFVPEQNLIGRPVLIYWSYKSTASDYPTNSSVGDRISSLISVLIHFPVRTRWERTLRRVR